MPSTRRFCETLFRASLHLLVIVIPFTAMAIPVFTQEFSRSSTLATAAPMPATDSVSSKLANKEVIDIVIPLLIFLLFFWCISLVGGFSFPPFVVIDWMITTFRPVAEAVLYFRPGALFRRRADDVVDSNGDRAPPQTHDEEAPTPVPTSSQRLPVQNVEVDALSTAPRCASSASDDSGLTYPSPA